MFGFLLDGFSHDCKGPGCLHYLEVTRPGPLSRRYLAMPVLLMLPGYTPLLPSLHSPPCCLDSIPVSKGGGSSCYKVVVNSNPAVIIESTRLASPRDKCYLLYFLWCFFTNCFVLMSYIIYSISFFDRQSIVIYDMDVFGTSFKILINPLRVWQCLHSFE